MDHKDLASLAWDCQDALNKCLSKGHLGHLLEDQRGLFGTWAANANIFVRSRASLEYRLQEAPYVRNLVQ
jgi:hypothetical protein